MEMMTQVKKTNGRPRRTFAERVQHFGDESGSIAIETAVGFMVSMAMVLGVIECCMMGYTYGMLADATREGVRYATVHGTDSSSCSGPSAGCGDKTAANVVNDVTTYASGLVGNLSGMVVTVTYPDGASTSPSRVNVAITYTYQPIFHYPGASHVLSVSSQGRIMY